MKKSSFLLGGALLLAALFTTSCKEMMGSLDNPVSAYLELESNAIEISIDETYPISASTISTMPIRYEISEADQKVITVDQNGVLTPVADGDATVIVYVEADEKNIYLPGKQELKVKVRTPLTFEAKKDGQINIIYNFNLEKPVVYTINRGAKKEIKDWTSIDVKAGDKVRFESANDKLTNGTGDWGFQIRPQMKTAVYGNIMSMISPDGDFLNNKTITQPYALKGLLCGDGLWEYNPQTDNWECTESYTVAHEKYELRLPATTLTEGCYSWMLAYTGFTETPELPATEIPAYAYKEMFLSCNELTKANAITAKTVGEYAFQDMFNSCVKLTESPAITAETIGDYACQNMFSGCQKIEKANAITAKTVGEYAFEYLFKDQPELKEAVAVNAEQLDVYACYQMFNSCPKLEKAPATLPATTLADHCYSDMFAGCTSLKKAPALPAQTLAPYCYNYMFGNCTSLAEAPELKAATLVDHCYCAMFMGCVKLNKLTCLATTMADYGISWMLSNAGTDESVTTRTFTRSTANNNWFVSDLDWLNAWYVPTGWTIDPAITAASAPAHRASSAYIAAPSQYVPEKAPISSEKVVKEEDQNPEPELEM